MSDIVHPPRILPDPDIIRAVSEVTARQNLGLLVRLRWIALLGQFAAIVLTHVVLGATLPLTQLWSVLALSAAINLHAIWRGHNPRPLGSYMLTLELLADVAALSALLYLTGGASNPFIILFILQVILGVMLVPMRQVFAILLATITAYAGLMGHSDPMAMGHGAHIGMFDLHLQGMFLGFVLAAVLLTWFVSGIRRNLAARDEQIAELRRRIVEDEQFVRLGVMASSTAHELGSPLTTVAVTLDDWADALPDDPVYAARQVIVMQTELTRCRRIVTNMLFASGIDRYETAEEMPLGLFLQELVDDWQDDGGTLCVSLPTGPEATMRIITDAVLEQALRNVLRNADQAGARQLAISARCVQGQLELCFRDNGPGFSQAVLDAPLRVIAPLRGEPGRGFGLYLLDMALRRSKGRWRIENTVQGGAQVTLTLPVLVDATDD